MAKTPESYKIAVDIDEFFRIFGDDTPENRKWLEARLSGYDDQLVRRFIRIFTDSRSGPNIFGEPRAFATRVTDAVYLLETLEREAYNQGWDEGRRALQQEISEKLGLL